MPYSYIPTTRVKANELGTPTVQVDLYLERRLANGITVYGEELVV